jgi:signal transduction histidine kinase
MNRTGKRPLAARVATLQTWLTALTLLLVTVATAAAVSVMLSRKTDQTLEGVLARVSYYAAQKPAAELDLAWLAREVDEVRPSNVRVELREPKGRLVFARGEGPQLPPGSTGCSTQAELRVCSTATQGLSIAVGKARHDDAATLRGIVAILAALSIGATLGVALLSRKVTAKAVEPLSRLTNLVARLEPGAGERLDLRSNVAEVDLLAEKFDGLVARFEDALEREKRFTAEASHELRTPLALALAEMDALARGEGDGYEPKRAMDALNRLAQLAESLLWFARAQGRVVDERTDVVNISDVIRDQVEALTKAHPQRRFQLDLPDEALVQAEEPLLARALGNLFDNAVKYGGGADVEVSANRAQGSLRVTVVNGGAGIPEAARARVFVPFFRSNQATPHAEGFGLGLPFARAVARAHGGDLRLGTDATSKTEVVLELPLVGWSDAATLG